MGFRVLGEVEVVGEDGSARPLGSPNQRTVLAVLLAKRNTVVTADALVDALWGDRPPPSAVATLRTYVSRLRRIVGDPLQTRGNGYCLAVGPDEVDCDRFDALLDAATSAGVGAIGAASDAVALLDEALALWHGAPFGDRGDLDAVRAEAVRLAERRRAAIEARLVALHRAGRHEDAVAAGEAAVAEEPLREGAWAVLIEALAACVRPAEALRAYQRAAAALADAGLQPSPRLRDAERNVLDAEQVVARVTTTHVEPEPASTPPLAPRYTSSFVGRDEECADVAALLARAPVVTLVGPGGVGKTRLAHEVAALVSAQRSIGCRVVELARLDDPSSVPAAVAAGLGFTVTGTTPIEALDHAGRLELLLLLDNAEHVLDEVAAVAERLTAHGGPLRVLVTSRERLGVDGEHLWPVNPLPTAGPTAPARRLFVERARATRPNVTLTEDDPHVGRIVERVDGLPLAVEMAAAQLHTMGIEDLADVLDERLTVLRSPRRGAHERHRDIRSLLEWSESRLSPRGAGAFAELSVFAGPVTAADIDAVLQRADAADDVRELVERSLVTADVSATPTRFSLLHIVRVHAAERLRDAGRADELAERHARWFLSVARDADARLRTVDEQQAAQRLESVFGELRAAHWWARENDPDLAAELCAHLHLYAHSRIVDEVLHWAEELCATRPDDDPWLPVLLASAATRAINRGELSAARVLAARAVEVARDDRWALPAYEALGDTWLYSGQVAESRAAHRTLARLGEEIGDIHYRLMGAVSVALIDGYAGGAGGDSVIDAIELPQQLSPTLQSWLAFARGELLQESDAHAAFAHLEQAIAHARCSGSRFFEGIALVSACSLRARVGAVEVAFRSFRDAIDHWARLADLTHQRTTLRNLVILFMRADDPEAAAELLGSVRRDGVPVFAGEARRLDAAQAWAMQGLGAERFEARFDRGHRRDVASAAARALDAIDARPAAVEAVQADRAQADRAQAGRAQGSADQGSGEPSRASSTTSGTSRPKPDARS